MKPLDKRHHCGVNPGRSDVSDLQTGEGYCGVSSTPSAVHIQVELANPTFQTSSETIGRIIDAKPGSLKVP